MSDPNPLASLLAASLMAVGVLGSAPAAHPTPVHTSFLSRLQLSNARLGQSLRGAAGTLIAAAAVFVLVAGLGAAISFWRDAPGATDARSTIPSSRARSGAEGDLARLESYTRSIGADDPASKAAAGDLLPDVNTMIERLAARLEAAPDDVKGWRMLGWSYFNTGRYDESANAYARAAALDPGSDELKRLHEEAKAKASGSSHSPAASPSQTDVAAKSGEHPHDGKLAKAEAAPAVGRDPAIRAMVDGLAARLEGSPRDVEGWARLMRSRLVLGEREAAAAAYSRALEVFKDDAAATGQITAAANELGLKAE